MKIKKSVIIGVVLLLSIASCKKKYTCECITTTTESSETKTEMFQQDKLKKKDATKECESLNYTEALEENGSITRTCEIK